MRKPIQLVSTHYSGTDRRWKKTSSHQLSCTHQDHQKMYLAHVKSGRHFSNWMCEIFFDFGSMSRILPHHIRWVINTKNSLQFTIGKYEYKVPFGLKQAPAYFQEFMIGVWKDFPFAITYLDDIIIFSRAAEEHLDHIRQVFKKLWNLSYQWNSANATFAKEIQHLGRILSTMGIRWLPLKTKAMQPPKSAKQACAFLGHVGYYRKLIKNFAKIANPLTWLTHHKAKFDWTQAHHTAFMTLKESIVQRPILHYPDPPKKCIVYMDTLDNTCRAHLLQEHDGTKFPVAFLSHNFTETQRKWSTPEQEAYGVYYAVTKWNYYLWGSNIIVHNDHKPLVNFLNGNNETKKSTDEEWNLQPTISHSNETKLLTAYRDWSNYQTIPKPQSQCWKPQIWMDQHSIQKVKHYNNAKQPRTQAFKHSTHDKSCYIWLNHSGNHTGYYTKTLNSWETQSPTPDAEDASIL